MKDKFEEYVKELQGMERLELILDLLVDRKITKAQATILIVNDKQFKEEPIKWEPYQFKTPFYGGVPTTTSPYTITPTVTTAYSTFNEATSAIE